MTEFGLIWLLLLLMGLLEFTSAQEQIFGEGAVKKEPPKPTNPPTEFIVYDRHQMPCILVKMDMTLIVEPKRTANKKVRVPVPKWAEVSGNCGQGDDSRMVISWSSFKFMWHFQKSRVSDAWYVDSIHVSYNTSDKAFSNITVEDPEMIQTAHSPDPSTLFLTPIGRSYTCTFTQSVKLTDDLKRGRVTVKISRFQVQPFAAMTHRRYGDGFKCPEEAGRNDESVPFLVGSLLALSVLGTIGGYGGYRYFKVKKIEYDTMEE